MKLRYLTKMFLALILTASCGDIENPVETTLTNIDINHDDPKFVAFTYKSPRGAELPYRLYIPENTVAPEKYPLILYLHNASGRGYDNKKQITGSNYWGTHLWVTTANQSSNPCYVLVPQCGLESIWTDLSGEEPSAVLQLVIQVIQNVQTAYPIDPNRIYAVGVSMGGTGVWDLVCKQPDLFAAAIPISGGGDTDLIDRITTLPLWVFNNAADQTIDIEATRDMIESLREAGARPKYTEFANSGKSLEQEVFQEINLSTWLFAQQRPPIR